MAKGHIFKIVLLVATVVLAALQGIAEMEEDSVNNILEHKAKEGSLWGPFFSFSINFIGGAYNGS